jgi:hypothetical protein
VPCEFPPILAVHVKGYDDDAALGFIVDDAVDECPWARDTPASKYLESESPTRYVIKG